MTVASDVEVPPGALLVARLSALGDVIHTLPAVNALARARPDLRIGWVVEGVYGGLVRDVGRVETVVEVGTRRWRRSLMSAETRRAAGAAVRQAREFVDGGSFVDFQGLMKSAVWGPFSRATRRIGFGPGSIREKGALLLLTESVEVDPSLHVIEQNLTLASSVAGKGLTAEPLDFGSFEKEPLGEYVPEGRERFAVVLPATGRSEKNWPVERFSALARELVETFDLHTLVLWGPGEERMAREIAENAPSAWAAPPTTISELTWLLSRAAIVIGGDTGPLHIAAAAGVPVLGIFGPTSPARNGPYGKNCGVVGSFGREMESISVEEALDALQRFALD